jgi:hypothetical protein
MLHAMLHGKLTRQEEDMEDLLTSNVFGLLRYVPADAALLPFLGAAKDVISGLHLENWLRGVVALEGWTFWPALCSAGCIPCEPDVDLVLSHADGSRTRLLIEAKYRSGKSSFASAESEQPKDQLAREFDNLSVAAGAAGIDRYAVVYVTADVACPREEIEASAQEYLAKRGTKPILFWLSWRTLTDVLNGDAASAYPILGDLRQLLLRMHLFMFRSLPWREVKGPEWRFAWAMRVPAAPTVLFGGVRPRA